MLTQEPYPYDELIDRALNFSGPSEDRESAARQALACPAAYEGYDDADKLSSIISRLGLTRAQFAKDLGVTVGTVNRWIARRAKIPTYASAYAKMREEIRWAALDYMKRGDMWDFKRLAKNYAGVAI